jgi:hypothetical protein
MLCGHHPNISENNEVIGAREHIGSSQTIKGWASANRLQRNGKKLRTKWAILFQSDWTEQVEEIITLSQTFPNSFVYY